MIKIDVRDFQSIAHQVVDVEGFAVVVGRSNIGKSAVARAVKAALTGAPADDYVRHGPDCLREKKSAKTCKCFCSVHITGEGVDLLWEKGDAVNRYVYNGREYGVVGRGTPEFLGDPFSPVALGGERVLLQVFDQFAPLFLLDRSGTVVADALSDVAKLDQINDAVRLVEKDRKEANVTRKVRQGDIVELERLIGGYEGLDGALHEVAAVESRYTEIGELEQRHKQLSGLAESVARVLAAIGFLSPMEALHLPAVGGVTAVWDSYLALSRFVRVSADKEAAINASTVMGEVALPDLERFLSLGAGYRSLDRWSLKLTTLKSFFASAKQAGDVTLPDAAACDELGARHRALTAWHARVAASAVAVAELKGQLSAIEESEQEVMREFAALGVCPTCSQPVRARPGHAEGISSCLD